MNLNDKMKDLKRLSKKYDFEYVLLYLPSRWGNGLQKHIFVWIPYSICNEVLPLLISDTEEHSFSGSLSHNEVCLDLSNDFSSFQLQLEKLADKQ